MYRSTCSTPTSTATPTGRARSPTSFTAATASTGSGRSSCSASAACACSARLGLDPTVFHMNEGHSAFLQLERLRELVEDGGPPRDAALQRLRASTVFTTHTPVPAGNEVFDAALVERDVAPARRALRLRVGRVRAFGRVQDEDSRFGLTPFALRTSSYANGVSALHGEVSREMWRNLWPDRVSRRCADRFGHERRARAHMDRRRPRCAAR